MSTDKYQILRGRFFWELEHSLNDFEVLYYDNYKDAIIDSLRKALEIYQDPEGLCMQLNDLRIQSTRKKIFEDIEKIENLKNGNHDKYYYVYNDNHSEYHFRLVVVD